MLKKGLVATAFFLAIVALCSTAWADVHTNRRSSRSRPDKRVVKRGHDKDKRHVRRSSRDRDRRERRRRLVRKYIPGHYETIRKRVWHEGYWETCTIPAVYEKRIVIVTDPRTGESWEETRTVCVRPEKTVETWVEGWWETRYVRVYIPGKWIYVYVDC